jgi:hypothetical protein
MRVDVATVALVVALCLAVWSTVRSLREPLGWAVSITIAVLLLLEVAPKLVR